jgi:hypothetical protein
MNPLVIALLAGAGGLGLYKGYRYYKSKHDSPEAISQLVKGQTYAGLAVLAPGPLARGLEGDMAAASKDLKDFFTKNGFTVLDDPAPQDDSEVGNFNSNAPSTWKFKATWTLDSPFVTQGAPGISLVTFRPAGA